MDLQYLLYLQENVRNETLTPIMMWFSNFAISFWLMAAIFCVYWCLSKKAGYFILASYTITSFLNGVVKLSFCIYRPWIRNPQIVPPIIGNIDAKKTASGYSFPSGHTQLITAYFTSGAYLVWLKQKWLSILMIIVIFIVAFSRNYLGVHTPQDVVVGFILGCLSTYWAYLLINREKKDKKSDIKLLSYGIIIGIVALLYFIFKNYPTIIDAQGKPIVDPQKMMKDGFLCVGVWYGFILGWFLEKYYVKFKTDGSITIKIIKAIIGVATLYLMFYNLSSLFYKFIPSAWARLLQWFVTTFYAMVIYPLLFKFFEGKLSNNNKQEE